MKKFNLFFIALCLLLSTDYSYAIQRKMNSQDQYSPLCIDFARRIITDKVAFYQSIKKNNLRKRSTASEIKFNRLPYVVNHHADKKVISLILKSIKDKRNAKNFTQKIDAEDKLINGIARVMKQDGKVFMNSCVNLYAQAEKKCNSLISKDFNKYTTCLSSMTNEQSPVVSKFVPFINYKQKTRSVASNNRHLKSIR